MTTRQKFDVPPVTTTPAGTLASVVGTPADGDSPVWNAALGQWEPGSASSGAPTNAEYLVGASDGTLSAERVVTNTTTVEWDLATTGQAKAKIVNNAPLPGSPTTTTQSPGDNSTKLATTAYVDAAVASGSSAPTAPTTTPPVWIKMDDAGITVNGSNQPTAIPNAGTLGGSCTLNATLTKRGVVVASSRNGKPCLQLDGVDDFLRLDFTATNDPTHTALIAYKRRVNGTGGIFCMCTAGTTYGGTATRMLVYMSAGADPIPKRVYLDRNGTIVGTTAPYGTPGSIISVRNDGLVHSYLHNGVYSSEAGDPTLAAANNIIATQLIIGGWPSTNVNTGDNPSAIDFYEFMYFGTGLSDEDLWANIKYLSHKWKIGAAQVG